MVTRRTSFNKFLLVVAGTLVLAGSAAGQAAQPISDESVRALIAQFKEDPRGPFQIVKWFCPDGSTIGARERCAQPGGIQHAVPKDIVVELQRRNGIFFGQILAGTPNNDFLDQKNDFSRVKQYQLEKYLIRADDGWILRRGRYYRGAYQVEDEEAWGKQLLEQISGRPDLVRSHFFLIREAAKDIPHANADNLIQKIRTVSREVSDADSRFLDARVKIHGQPDPSDTLLVAAFLANERTGLSRANIVKLEQLLSDMRAQYSVDYGEIITSLSRKLSKDSGVVTLVAETRIASLSDAERVEYLARLLNEIRGELPSRRRGSERLALLDISLAAEAMMFRSVGNWRPRTLRELVRKTHALSYAAVGSGMIEHWEWNELESSLPNLADMNEASLDELKEIVAAYRRAVEWGVGMASATYEKEIGRYLGFEPLAAGFLDDRLRSTVMLALGEAASRLGDELAIRSGVSNEVMNLPGAAGIRGLNRGVAIGTLEVVTGSVEHIDFQTDKIYVMVRTPAELKPVAGIATVSEGNMVSHVQLLARNLGIPNAVISPELVQGLLPMSGTRVFYAVSPGGAVRIKAAARMSASERALVEERKRSEERIRVPTNRLQLESKTLTSLYDLRANVSGRICGPKAANLGQLSALFPGRVAPGFIVPFGVFRQHMDQRMPNTDQTYWQFLRSIFEQKASMERRGVAQEEVDAEVLRRLSELRKAIESMPLQAEFVSNLRRRFQETLGLPTGSVNVFVRSDTNMEDLKDFTGAGLNLTVPNVSSEVDLLQAVRRVWASPYRERGYRWRQKYLLNPEDVYPSLLVLKSVNVDKSGVLITAGVSTGAPADMTIAMNRGVGGAVDGQAAETYLLRPGVKPLLLSPGREPTYRTLPTSGGVASVSTAFDQRILSPAELDAIRAIGAEIRSKLPGAPGIETAGPFDVELGLLDGKINLFQARPFVDNKDAIAASYLAAMDGQPKKRSKFSLDENLQSKD